jgi:long-chain acyl-CoA synthetase
MIAEPLVRRAELLQEAKQARSLVALFEATAQRRGVAVAMRTKREGKWQEISWSRMAEGAREVSDGLASLGVGRGDRVAIIGETQVEWMLADLGILGAGAVTVTIYQSNTPEECRYILDDSGARFVFCDTDIQVAKIRAVRDRLPTLEGIIRTQGPAADGFERTFDGLQGLGRAWRKDHPAAHEERVAALGPDDPASFIYTSGTTGAPKGVVLTHGNWTYEGAAVAEIDIVRPDDLTLMFLPMAHSFAKVNQAVWIAVGSGAAFVESLDKIVDNSAEVHPTVMPAVPRVFEKAYNGVMAQGMARPGIEGMLFAMAKKGFEDWVAAREQGRTHSSLGWLLARKVVFPKLAQALSQRFGGRMRLFVSGGAPLTPRIAYFFEQLGFTVLEGYGLTETSAATCVSRPGKNRIGTVGPPVPGTKIRIAEDGEIWVKGPGLMREYYRNPAATKEVFQGGWFATGDIGSLDEAGCLKITDRKKDIIVTSGGKNIAPQNLEGELKSDPLISQVMVHGDKRRFLSALVTLNDEVARKWASENGVSAGAPLHEDPRMVARIQRSFDALNAKLASYSTIKRFAILPKDFTQEAGELTPTLKVKRKVVSQKYQKLLDSFYAE